MPPTVWRLQIGGRLAQLGPAVHPGPGGRGLKGAVAALGVTQIVGYGTLYYAFPILVPAMAADLGVSPVWLFAAFSAGLVAGGLAAPWAGRAMDRFGPARVMVAGSAAAGAALAALAGLPLGPWGVGATIIVIELIAVCVTYDAAFATLVALRGPGARRGITNLTLIAGFASTLFWPLTGWLAGAVGWQATYGLYAALHIGLALPLHLALAQGTPRPARPDDPAPTAAFAPLTPPAARRGVWLLATGFTLTGMALAALTVHLVPLLTALGLETAAYGAGMAMGPAQVAVRVIEATAWRHRHPVLAALVSGGCVPLAALILLALPGTSAAVGFAVVLGAGAGLASIVRGALPLALFGPLGFGARLGRLAAPRQVAAALAPLGFALLLARGTPQAALAAAALVGIAGLLPIWALARLISHDRRNALGSGG